MAKSVDRVVGIVIAGTSVPTSQSSVRTELDHAEWNRGTRESVTVAARTDERINVSNEVNFGFACALSNSDRCT